MGCYVSQPYNFMFKLEYIQKDFAKKKKEKRITLRKPNSTSLARYFDFLFVFKAAITENTPRVL
jgi:hypothetical protein